MDYNPETFAGYQRQRQIGMKKEEFQESDRNDVSFQQRFLILFTAAQVCVELEKFFPKRNKPDAAHWKQVARRSLMENFGRLPDDWRKTLKDFFDSMERQDDIRIEPAKRYRKMFRIKSQECEDDLNNHLSIAIKEVKDRLYSRSGTPRAELDKKMLSATKIANKYLRERRARLRIANRNARFNPWELALFFEEETINPVQPVPPVLPVGAPYINVKLEIVEVDNNNVATEDPQIIQVIQKELEDDLDVVEFSRNPPQRAHGNFNHLEGQSGARIHSGFSVEVILGTQRSSVESTSTTGRVPSGGPPSIPSPTCFEHRMNTSRHPSLPDSMNSSPQLDSSFREHALQPSTSQQSDPIAAANPAPIIPESLAVGNMNNWNNLFSPMGHPGAQNLPTSSAHQAAIHRSAFSIVPRQTNVEAQLPPVVAPQSFHTAFPLLQQGMPIFQGLPPLPIASNLTPLTVPNVVPPPMPLRIDPATLALLSQIYGTAQQPNQFQRQF